jgi:hypothetical protein
MMNLQQTLCFLSKTERLKQGQAATEAAVWCCFDILSNSEKKE